MKTSAMKMTKPALAVAIATAIYAQGAAAADADMDQRLESLEQRLQYTEERLKAQDETILAQQESRGITISGLIEVEASNVDTNGSAAQKDVSAATVEVGIGADISDAVSAEVLLKYEDDGDDNSTDVFVDTAIITLAPEGSPASFTFGKTGVPFGVYDTNLVSDPITKDLGDTSDNGVIQADFEAGIVAISAYAYNGDNDGKVDDFGINFGFGFEDAGLSFNLGHSNRLQEKDVAALAFSAMYEAGPFTVIAEHVAASDKMADGKEPSATNFEVGMGTLLGGMASTFAIGYQTTDEANGSVDLAEKRALAALSIGIMENTGLAFELKKDTSYTNVDTNTFTAKLSVEF